LVPTIQRANRDQPDAIKAEKETSTTVTRKAVWSLKAERPE
jgi:hypothetical protein